MGALIKPMMLCRRTAGPGESLLRMTVFSAIFVSLTIGMAFSQTTHFTVPNKLTGSSMTVLLKTAINPTLNGTPIQTGDEIAVFNHSGLCVGATAWNGSNTYITVWGQSQVDSTTTDGMRTGEVLVYRMWQSAQNVEMPAYTTYLIADSLDDSLYGNNYVSILASLTGLAVPASPTLTAPSSGALNEPVSLSLNWGTVANAATYAVQVSTDAGFGSTVTAQWGLSLTTASISGLANSTTYYWRTDAQNITGVSSWSGVSSFTTIIATPVQASPANNAAAQPLNLNLSWNGIAGALSYSLEVSTSAAFGSIVYSQSGITTTHAAPGGLAANGTYYWQVNATNSSGTGNWSSAWEFSTITQTVTTASSGTSGNILGIAAGAGKGYVAVGTNGSVSTSTDGVHWTVQTSGTHHTLHSVVYDEFVAVGDSGSILTSPDGVTWTIRTSGTTVNLYGVDYNGTQFVAVGNSGTILTSTDGITWATATSGTSMNLMSVTYGDGLFTVVGNSGTILTSSNGTSWSPQSSGTSVNLASIAFGGTQFIAVGLSGTILGSSDGINWTGRTSGTTDSLLSVTYGAGQFAAVGSGSLLLTSTDGTTWTGGSTGAGTTLSAVIISGSQIIGGGSSGVIVNSTTTDVPLLSSPADFASNQPTGSVSLNWGNSSGAVSYTVQVSTNASFATTVMNQSGLVATAQTIGPLSTSTTYYWEVNAQYATYTGAWSSVWNFTTVPAAPGIPALVTPSNNSTNQSVTPVLSWTTSSNAATYAVQVSTVSGFGSTVTAQIGLTGTSASVTGLASSTTYFWRAGAKNAGGVSGWSTPNSFTTIIAAPVAPALATPTSGTVNLSTSPVLTWGTVTGAATYSVLVSTAANFATTVSGQTGLTGVTASLIGLANSTTYYWEVNAANAGGTSNWSGLWSFTTIIATPVAPTLATPTSGTVNASTSPALTWGAVTGAATYNIQVSTAANFATVVSSQTGLTGLTASLSGLANSTTYYWEVNAANIDGTSPWSSVWSFATIIAAPVAPTLATPTSGAVNEPVSLSLNWGAVTGAATYSVLVSTAANFATTVSSQTGIAGLTASLSGLANSTTYYWEVNAANIGGTSNWSAVWNFTTIIAIPGVPQLSAPANNAAAQPVSLSLSWGSVSGATGYVLMVSTAANFATTAVSQTGFAAAQYALTGLANNVTYYWEVGATNVNGASAWSTPWSFTTLSTLSVPVSAGWNCISLNIRPSDSSTGGVFGTQKGFVLVKDIYGNVYCPNYTIDQIVTLHTGVGYQMYSDSVNTISTSGAGINALATPVALSQGWNIFAYLPQESQSIESQLAGITSQILIVKNNAGQVYWPDYGIDAIGSMSVGQGYFTYMKSAATLTYAIAKKTANGAPVLRLPDPRHYANHANTGSNASVLASRVLFGDRPAPDSCEIGAFDGNGNLVGSGTVIHGLAAFAVWGQNSQTKVKDGLNASEPVVFKLWNKTTEYPLEFKADNGGAVRYTAQAVLLGTFAVPEGALITRFNLAKVYPNPFHGFVQVAFDVPSLSGAAAHDVEVNIFNMNGILVHQLAHGKYPAGHYVVSWNGESVGGAVAGSGIYLIQMKAANFDKRLKLVKLQ